MPGEALRSEAEGDIIVNSQSNALSKQVSRVGANPISGPLLLLSS